MKKIRGNSFDRTFLEITSYTWYHCVAVIVLITFTSSLFSPVFARIPDHSNSGIVKPKIAKRISSYLPTLLPKGSIQVTNHKTNSVPELFVLRSKYQPYFEIGGAKYFNNNAKVAGIYDLFIPLFQTEEQLFFTDLRIFDRSGHSVEGNIHLGYRRLNTASERMFGLYGALDWRKSPAGNNFIQTTLGFEHWKNKFFIGGNFYMPLGERRKLAGEVSSISTRGMQITFEDITVTKDSEQKTISKKYDRIMPGADAEIGYAITDNLTSYIGGYYFAARHTDIMAGPKVRVTYDYQKTTGRILGIIDGLSFEAGAQYDKVRRGSAYLGIKMKFGLLDLKKNSNLTGFERHMIELVRRDPDIVVGKIQTDATTANTSYKVFETPKDKKDDDTAQSTQELLKQFGLGDNATLQDIQEQLLDKYYSEQNGERGIFAYYFALFEKLEKRFIEYERINQGKNTQPSKYGTAQEVHRKIIEISINEQKNLKIRTRNLLLGAIGLPEGTSDYDVTKHYRQFQRKYHPDNRNSSERGEKEAEEYYRNYWNLYKHLMKEFSDDVQKQQPSQEPKLKPVNEDNKDMGLLPWKREVEEKFKNMAGFSLNDTEEKVKDQRLSKTQEQDKVCSADNSNICTLAEASDLNTFSVENSDINSFNLSASYIQTPNKDPDKTNMEKILEGFDFYQSTRYSDKDNTENISAESGFQNIVIPKEKHDADITTQDLETDIRGLNQYRVIPLNPSNNNSLYLIGNKAVYGVGERNSTVEIVHKDLFYSNICLLREKTTGNRLWDKLYWVGNKMLDSAKWIYERPKMIVGTIVIAGGCFSLKYLFRNKVDLRKSPNRGGMQFLGKGDGGGFPPSSDDAPHFGKKTKDEGISWDNILLTLPLVFTVGSGGMNFPIFVPRNVPYVSLESNKEDLVKREKIESNIHKERRSNSPEMFTTVTHNAQLAARQLEQKLSLDKGGYFGGIESLIPLITLPDWNYGTNGVTDLDSAKSMNLNESTNTTERSHEVNLDYEYEDQDINALLLLRAQEVGLDLRTTVLVSPLDNTRTQLQQHLVEEMVRYQREILEERTPFARILLLPLNLYNLHWVGLVIRFNAENQVETIQYVDPLGYSIPVDVEATLRNIYGRYIVIQNLQGLRQTDGMACGPLTIENIIQVAQNRLDTHLIEEREIREIRHHHIELLEHFEPALQFYFRQNRGFRSFGYETTSGGRLSGMVLIRRPLPKCSISGFEVAMCGGMDGEDALVVGDVREPLLHDAVKKSFLLILKEILKISTGTLPYVAMRAFIPIVNSIMVARLGASESAALLLINTINDFTGTVLNSPISYAGTLVGLSNNPDNEKNIGEIAQATLVFSFILSLPQIAFVLFSRQLTDLFAPHSADSLDGIIQSFFHIYLFALPFNSLELAFENVALGMKRVYLPLVIRILGATAFLSIGYPLIGGHLSAQALGIRGSAIANVGKSIVSNLAAFGIFLWLSQPNRMLFNYNFFKLNKSGQGIWKLVSQLTKKGLSIILMMISEVGIMYSTNLLIGRAGSKYMSAQIVLSQYQDAIVIFSSALATSAQTLIANSMIPERQNVLRYGIMSIAVSLVLPLIYAVFCIFLPRTLINVFIDTHNSENDPIVSLLVNGRLMLISAINNCCLAIRFVAAQSLIGTGQFGLSLFGNMGTTWIGVGIGALMTYVFGVDTAVGFNIGLGIGFIISSIGLLISWFRSTK